MDQLEEIKSKIDLVQFIAEYLPLQKAGRNFKTACPFHSEKTPSFIVSPERQIWHCFGCSRGGDVFGFLMEYERIDFGEALRLLAKRTGVVLKSYRPNEDEARKNKLYEVNHLASEFFHFLLLNHPSGKPALDYILGRGISKDSLKLFKIGYSPNLWDGLQKYLVGRKDYSPLDLENAGLIIPSHQSPVTSHQSLANYYDRFRHRLMFPLLDHWGNVCGFAGRVIPTAEEKTEANGIKKEARLPSPTVQAVGGQAKYVNTPETLVYHKSDLLYPLNLTKEEIKKENRAVVVEGELDAISSFQIGVKNVVAIKGSALTENQVKLLKRYCENLVLGLDTDTAGDQAARRGIETADKEGLNIRVIDLKKYKDPDEAAQKDPKYYKEKLKTSLPFFEFLINSAFERFSGETPEGKRKIGEELIPQLAKIGNEIIKNHYIRILGQKLNVSEEAIINQIKKIGVGGSTMKPSPKSPKIFKTRVELLEEYLMALYLQSGQVDLLAKEADSYLQISGHQKILLALKEYLKNLKGKFKSKEFYAVLPTELTEIFNNYYLIDLGEKLDDEVWFSKTLKRTQKEIKLLRTRRNLSKAAEEIKKLETESKTESNEWQKAQENFRLLSESLASINGEDEV